MSAARLQPVAGRRLQAVLASVDRPVEECSNVPENVVRMIGRRSVGNGLDQRHDIAARDLGDELVASRPGSAPCGFRARPEPPPLPLYMPVQVFLDDGAEGEVALAAHFLSSRLSASRGSMFLRISPRHSSARARAFLNVRSPLSFIRYSPKAWRAGFGLPGNRVTMQKVRRNSPLPFYGPTRTIRFRAFSSFTSYQLVGGLQSPQFAVRAERPFHRTGLRLATPWQHFS